MFFKFDPDVRLSQILPLGDSLNFSTRMESNPPSEVPIGFCHMENDAVKVSRQRGPGSVMYSSCTLTIAKHQLELKVFMYVDLD